MRLLPKQISKEDFDYVSNKSVDSLKSDIQQLFDKTKGWNFSINLTGEFTSDNEFRMTPILIDRWDGEYKKTRIEQLNSMLRTVDKMNE